MIYDNNRHMDKKIPEDMLLLHEELLKAQLQVIRRLREPKKRETKSSRSNMSVVIDLLRQSDHPMHVSEIIAQAKERYDITLDRESLVSALVKKIRSGIVARTAPNTFTLR